MYSWKISRDKTFVSNDSFLNISLCNIGILYLPRQSNVQSICEYKKCENCIFCSFANVKSLSLKISAGCSQSSGKNGIEFENHLTNSKIIHNTIMYECFNSRIMLQYPHKYKQEQS